MEVKFMANMTKGNNLGVGFIRLPSDIRSSFVPEQNIKVTIYDGDLNHHFYSRLKDYSGLGTFVPYQIVLENDLIGKRIEVSIEKIDGFFTTILKDGKIYIPKSISETLKLKSNDIVVIEGIFDGNKEERINKIFRRNIRNTAEYFCIFDRKLARKKGIFKVKSILSKDINKINLENIISDFNYAKINENTIILYSGNMTPLIINSNFDFSEIAYYLGCYFSDGTKKGFSWALSASTFEQAEFFLKKHTYLIKNSNLNFYISVTSDNRNSDELKENLIKKWSNVIQKNITEVRIFHTVKPAYTNRNRYGTLVMREGKQIEILYYKKLIETLIKKMKTENKHELGYDFICGILEGDGCANAKSRGHISIATNFSEKDSIEDVLRFLKLEYRIYREGENKYTVRIGALCILRNLPLLKDKLFKYYPKRRQIFLERFLDIGANKFILGKQKHVSAWVKAYLRDNKILDDNYQLTNYGKEIRTCLKEMSKEITCKP